MAKPQKPRVDLNGLRAQAIVDTLTKRYGEGTLILASKAAGATIEFIPSGNYAFDFATGGGFPKNRITEVHGQYSSGKSTITLKTIAEFQRIDKDNIAALIDLEKAFDPLYAKAIGVDLNRLILVNPDSGEQSVDLVNDLLEISFDLLMVIDSLAAMTPTAEVEGSMDQQFMGLQARLVNRAFRVATARMKRGMYKRNAPATTLIVLNQMREKVGVVYGDPNFTPGGKGKDFYYSVIAKFGATAGGKIIEEIERNGVKRKIQRGQVHSLAIKKNKCGASQYDEAEYEYYTKPYKHYVAYEYNNDQIAFQMGRYFGIIKTVTKKTPKGDKVLKYVCPNGKELSPKESLAVSQLHKLPKTMRKIYYLILAELRAEKESEEAQEDEE